jgi:ABC-type nitrate/sulfonate/bicarbonate transport system substrate-binding protein
VLDRRSGDGTRVAYSALLAGIGTLWLTHEEGIFRQNGLDSNLVYIRGGTTAVQALLAGEIQFGHLQSPLPVPERLGSRA